MNGAQGSGLVAVQKSVRLLHQVDVSGTLGIKIPPDLLDHRGFRQASAPQVAA